MKQNSNKFIKYYALENHLTNNKEPFLRDYSVLILYNKSDKSKFYHEQLILYQIILLENYIIKIIIEK